ncbi:GIY-YIG nuclease family protein [Aliifodinibius sp. S!AR15-10]|uniref:GIY-YIG nuclease family protein n=1 Tax=Aliifodinibius sp. S!AR15-10 TaxID=2950437 RepID=UPI00286269A3|nr:GIY-YIG nuclease family protein [Aliifodinibius sp. S!AR15-10]MDR8394640.1 GIY-YIG nuclease family protein [Aliifodinibius sp. S!AR15-10]
MDFFDKRENKVLVNTSIHEKAKLSKEEFLSRVSNFKGLRTRIDHISLFIREESDHHYITDLWRLINEGDFRLRNFPNYVLFVVALENKFFDWFWNTQIELIRKQICNWVSAICLKNPESKEDILNSLYEPYSKEIEYIIENFYSSNFEEKYSFKGVEDDVQKQRELILERNSEYEEASKSYLSSPPPKELPNPFDENISIRSYRGLRYVFPKIPVLGSYIREDDWVAIVERDMEKMKEYYGYNTGKSQFSLKDLKEKLEYAETDTMMRGESETEPWEIWKGMFEDGKNNDNLFDPIGNDLEGGFVYLRKEQGTSYYKIGYSSTESGVKSRRSGLQTGNPRPLVLKGYFPVSSTKTESKIHEYFDSSRREGEWFELTEQQAENILDQEWRREKHFF